MKILLALLCLGGGLYFIIPGLVKINTGMAIGAWPTAPGIIIRSQVQETEGIAWWRYEAKVVYEYSIEKKTYTGTVLHPALASFGGKQEYTKVVRRLSSGTRVRVRYNPARPSESSLASGFFPAVLSPLLPGLLLLLVPFIMILEGFLFSKTAKLLAGAGAVVWAIFLFLMFIEVPALGMSGVLAVIEITP